MISEPLSCINIDLQLVFRVPMGLVYFLFLSKIRFFGHSVCKTISNNSYIIQNLGVAKTYSYCSTLFPLYELNSEPIVKTTVKLAKGNGAYYENFLLHSKDCFGQF